MSSCTKKAALLLLVALAGLALGGCAELQRRELKRLATNYLDFEVKGDFINQQVLYDSISKALLFQPYRKETNPLNPSTITSYAIKDIALEGGKANLSFVATVDTTMPYGPTSTKKYDFVLHIITEGGQWRIDEVTSRREWIAQLRGENYGTLWIQELQAQARARR
jgi:hypothetical protein